MSEIVAPLAGTNIVRIIHLDDAGLANPKHEPYVVVAGIIINADREWKPIEDHLISLRHLHVPRDRLDDCASFSAKDLVHGTRAFDRETFPRQTRARILRKILSIPTRFNLPVIYGIADRRKPLPQELGRHEYVKTSTHLAYATAYMYAMVRANKWMHMFAQPNEVAMTIIEENTEMKRVVNRMHVSMQYPRLDLPTDFKDAVPIDRVMTSPKVEGKAPNSPLQIADALAYAIKHVAMQRPDAERLVRCFQEQVFMVAGSGDAYEAGEPALEDWFRIPPQYVREINQECVPLS